MKISSASKQYNYICELVNIQKNYMGESLSPTLLLECSPSFSRDDNVIDLGLTLNSIDHARSHHHLTCLGLLILLKSELITK